MPHAKQTPYAGWLKPDYLLLETTCEAPEREGVIALPKGIEAIACFAIDGRTSPELLMLYIAEKEYKKNRERLRGAGINPHISGQVTLETALRTHDQRQIYYADQGTGVADIARPSGYGVMQLHSAVDYVLELMRKKKGPTTQPLVLRTEQVDDFRKLVKTSFSSKPFHINGSAIYYTEPQTELVLREFIAKYGPMPTK